MHAFAADPERGVFILVFLLVVVGASLTLFALRAPVVKSHIGFGLWSRETLLLINNIILVVATTMVLMGTLYPLVLDSLTGAKLSVGPPYFNALFVPLMGILMLALSVGVLLRWKDTPVKWISKMLLPVLLLSGIAALGLGYFTADFNWAVVAVYFLSFWIAFAVVRDVLDKTRHRGLWSGMRKLTRSYWGMHLAHIGLAVCAIGAVLSTQFSSERDLKMEIGDKLSMGGYEFVFDGAKHFEGPNYISDKGTIRVFKDNKQIAKLHPEKRLYIVQQMPMTEAGIDPGFTRDLYVALGEPLDNGAWAVRVHIKPFVRWIWLGGFLTGFGGLLAAADRRYRVKVKRKVREALATGETAHV